MSKSLKLFGTSAIGIAVVLTAAVNFADRNIAPLPDNPRVMAALPKVETAVGGNVSAANASSTATSGKLGLGRAALAEEVAAWDLDVSPDDTGLPVGSGFVEDGEIIFRRIVLSVTANSRKVWTIGQSLRAGKTRSMTKTR